MNSSITDKTRVQIFHPALAPYRIDLFNSLAERLNVEIVFLRENVEYQGYDQAELLRRLYPPVKYLTNRSRLLTRGLSATIAEFEPDVVVTHEYSPLTIRLLCQSKVGGPPVAIWTADSVHVIQKERLARKLARRFALRLTSGLIVYTKETADLYADRFGYKGTTGVSPNVQSDTSIRARLTKALTLAESRADEFGLLNKRTILYVGRLAQVKRVDRLIRSFSKLRRHNADARLLIVGDGPERSALEAIARKLRISDQIVFFGHLEGLELSLAYNLGSLFALPSEYEPWGAVVNEALAGGLPSIVSVRAAAKDLVTSGKNGEIIDFSRTGDAASTLSTWLARVQPISRDHFRQLRPSLMPSTFSSAVSQFQLTVEEAATRR